MRQHYAEERRRQGVDALFKARAETIAKLLEGYTLLRLCRHDGQWTKWHVWTAYHPKTWIETMACGRTFRRERYAHSRLVYSGNLAEDGELRDVCRPCMTAVAVTRSAGR